MGVRVSPGDQLQTKTTGRGDGVGLEPEKGILLGDLEGMDRRSPTGYFNQTTGLRNYTHGIGNIRRLPLKNEIYPRKRGLDLNVIPQDLAEEINIFLVKGEVNLEAGKGPEK